MALNRDLELNGSRRSDVRRSVWAVRALFAATGILYGSWAARLPALASTAGADEAGVAIALVGHNVGAVIGLRLGSRVVVRAGSRKTLRIAAPGLALTLPSILLAHQPMVLAATLLAFGTVVSVCDVALNESGLQAEDQLGRRLLSGMHASFSLGMGLGSLIGAALEALHAPLAVGFAGVAVIMLPLSAIASGRLLPDRPTASAAPQRPSGPGWSRRLVAIGLLAFCAALAEGAANDWIALYLHTITGAPAGVAALGVAGFSVTMFVGRLLGDRLTATWGAAVVFRAGAGTAATALAIALLWPHPVPATLALVGCGLGISFTLPVAIAVGGRSPGLDRTRAVANTTTLGYLGFFTGPALIGMISNVHGLTLGLALPAVLLVAAAFAATALDLQGRNDPTRSVRRTV